MTDCPTQLETLTERDACLEIQVPTSEIASPVKDTEPPQLITPAMTTEQMMLIMKQQIEALTAQLDTAKQIQLPSTSTGEPSLKRQRTESPPRAAFEEDTSEEEDYFGTIIPRVPLHELGAEYIEMFKKLYNAPVMKEVLEKHVYYAMCIEWNLPVGNPNINFISPYKVSSQRMNGKEIEEQINVSYEWMQPELTLEPVSSFKVSKPRAKMMNDYLQSKNMPGNKLQSLISSIQNDKEDTTVRSLTVMQHNGSTKCKAKKFHYHIIVGVVEDGSNISQKAFMKKTSNKYLEPLTCEKHKLDPENLAHAFAYLAEKGPGRVYLGTTDAKIAGIMSGIKKWHQDHPNVAELPEVPVGIPLIDMDIEINPFLSATIPSSHQVCTTARHFDSPRITKARTLIEFYVSLMNAIRIPTLSLHEFRKQLLMTIPAAVEMVNMKFCLEEALYGKNHERLWDQHIARIERTTLKEYIARFLYPKLKQKHYNLYADQACTLFALQRVAPDWFRQIIRVNLHILGKNGKQNCLYIYGRPSMGKTHVLTLGLKWIFPVCQPNLNAGDFSLEELSLPHLLTIMDDCDPVIAVGTKMAEQLKHMMGGTENPVSVKHKSQKTALTSPVIWLSNKTDFNFFNIDGDELAAFNERILREPFAENYPYKASSGFWQFIHPVIMATLRSYLNLHKGQEPARQDEIAEACWRYLKNQRNLLYRISSFSQASMFQKWNSDAAQDDFSDLRSDTKEPNPTLDEAMETILDEDESNPYDLRH